MTAEILTRDATPADYDDYARLMPHLGVDDPIPSREHFAADLVHRTMFAIHDREVVGYSLYEVLADTGYVRNLVADPSRRRAGIGRTLMTAMRDRFVAAGARRWCLNVKPDNVPAIALYEACGLAPAYRSTAIRVPREIVLPTPTTTIADIDPADDAALEARFSLLRGQFASSRGRGTRRILKLLRDDALVGLAIFSPSFPGAFPFRVVEPALGAEFVAHFRTLVPDATWIQVMVDDDEPLRAALLDLGANAHLEILHMRGPLP